MSRARVVQNVAKFLSTISSDTYLVLYGYSTTVCDSIIAVGEYLPCPVFLIEDLQYGVEGSLGEHKKAVKHLERAGITPSIIPFDQIPYLATSSSNFVRTDTGKLVPLAQGREVIAIIGCEASDIDGNVLVPSRLRGIPSETAKFVEVFRSEWPETERATVKRKMLVISEGYKVYDLATPDILVSHAPVKLSLPGYIAYLFGLKKNLRLTKIELIKLNPSDIFAIIDDYGIHFSKENRIDLQPSFLQWQKHALEEMFPELLCSNIKKMLQESCTIICDLDGVIVDTEPLHFAAFADVVRDFGKNLTYQEYIEECCGLSDEEGAKNLIQRKNLSGSVNQIVKSKQQNYHKKLANRSVAQFFPGAIKLLQTLAREGKKLYLVTSSAPEDAEYFITKTELINIFPLECRYFGVEIVNRKKVFMKIIDKSQSEPTKCLLLDDSPRNLVIGTTLGINTIGFATTWPSEKLNACGVVSGADELQKRYIK